MECWEDGGKGDVLEEVVRFFLSLDLNIGDVLCMGLFDE